MSIRSSGSSLLASSFSGGGGGIGNGLKRTRARLWFVSGGKVSGGTGTVAMRARYAEDTINFSVSGSGSAVSSSSESRSRTTIPITRCKRRELRVMEGNTHDLSPARTKMMISCAPRGTRVLPLAETATLEAEMDIATDQRHA